MMILVFTPHTHHAHIHLRLARHVQMLYRVNIVQDTFQPKQDLMYQIYWDDQMSQVALQQQKWIQNKL